MYNRMLVLTVVTEITKNGCITFFGPHIRFGHLRFLLAVSYVIAKKKVAAIGGHRNYGKQKTQNNHGYIHKTVP